MSLPLKDVKEGERVLIRNADGTLFGVWFVWYAKKTQITARHAERTTQCHNFSIKTGCEVGGDRTLHRATAEEIAAALAEEQKRRADMLAAEDAKRKAAHDALPEAVRLARKVRAWLDGNEGHEPADIPLAPLRELCAWIDTQS